MLENFEFATLSFSDCAQDQTAVIPHQNPPGFRVPRWGSRSGLLKESQKTSVHFWSGWNAAKEWRKYFPAKRIILATLHLFSLSSYRFIDFREFSFVIWQTRLWICCRTRRGWLSRDSTALRTDTMKRSAGSESREGRGEVEIGWRGKDVIARIAENGLEEDAPANTSEEELQLQIAMALSKEEQRKKEEIIKSDEYRLQVGWS